MVDEMKKKMRRFEHLIGFTGILNVTSSDSMKRLIKALKSRYKQDVQNSLRLHRLEFFYDLVEGRRRKGCPKDEIKKKKVTEEEEEEGQQQEGSGTVTSDEVLSIQAKDVDDWKDLLTLSKIYYVLEHPRSEGLTWKRRIAKKRKIDKFGDVDLIEWRVAQNFHLRGLEEWVQSRSDARKLAVQQNDAEDLESDLDDEARELQELYDMLDPSGERHPLSKKGRLKRKGPSTADRPFKFQDECIEDWTESYSEDSDYSDAEDAVEEIEDFPDDIERKMGEFDETKMPISDEEESISELFSKYPEFSPYREDIFEQMDKTETLEKWYKLYHDICLVPDEPKEDQKLDQILEEEEEEEDEVPLKEPKEETAKQKEASKEIEMSLAEDRLEETKLEDVTAIEEKGKDEATFEKEESSRKETDIEGEAAKMPQTEAEIEEIEMSLAEDQFEEKKLKDVTAIEERGKDEATFEKKESSRKETDIEEEAAKMPQTEAEIEEIEMSLAEDRIEEKKLGDITAIEERGMDENAFEKEKISGKEIDIEGNSFKIPQTEAEIEEISKRDEEPKTESVEETVTLETTVGVPKVTEQGTAGIAMQEDEAELSKMEKRETEELMELKVPGVEPEKEEETVEIEAAEGIEEETGKGTEAETDALEEAAEMSKRQKKDTKEVTESKELMLELKEDEETVKLEVAKGVEENEKRTEARTDSLEEAAEMSKMKKEETKEQIESKELVLQSEKEEETVKLESAKEVAQETGKGAEAGTSEAAEMSKTEKEETVELTESKEVTVESEKREDFRTQELAEVPEQETKEDAIKGSETKLDKQEKDLVLGKQSEEVDKETTNEADTEVEKMAKKSVSQECVCECVCGAGPESDDEHNADS